MLQIVGKLVLSFDNNIGKKNGSGFFQARGSMVSLGFTLSKINNC